MANENGWGDGSANNNIGWGQGAINNNISWGKSQIDSWSGATDIDGGNPPVNSVAPAITGTAQEGQTLTCSTGTWSGTPTYSYQWKRNGSNIGSATNSTYTLVTADVAQSIKCTVTATNALGSSNADSNTVTPTSSVDSDAQAFITAASITDPTQQSAINTLVVDLKGYSIWTKFKAIYPIVGGVASSHAVNLKTPGTYNLSFATGWTHSATGMTPNGATYADTGLAPTLMTQDSIHGSSYLRNNTTSGGPAFSTEDATTFNNAFYLFPKITTSNNYSVRINDSTSAFLTQSNDIRGLNLINRTASNSKKYRINNTEVFALTTASTGRNSQSIYIARLRTSNTFFTNQYSFISFGDGLIDTEAANFYTAVQAFQTTLSRQV
jgi:hypothetical protein